MFLEMGGTANIEVSSLDCGKLLTTEEIVKDNWDYVSGKCGGRIILYNSV